MKQLQVLRLLVVGAIATGIGACASDGLLGPSREPLGAQRGALAAPAGLNQPKAGLEINYMEFTIDHHAMGVMMAQMCVEKAIHEELRELCQRNAEAQSREMAMLQGWLETWYGITYEPHVTPGDEQMMEMMAALEGAEFEIEFMEIFSRHHHQIVQRSLPVVDQAVHPELAALASQIVEAQTRDIRLMLSWLCEWYDSCHPRFGEMPAA